MYFVLREGRVSMGIELARFEVSVIQRVGTTLLVGDVLMLDLDNTTYSSDATESGIYGNAIAPSASGSGGTIAGLLWPFVLVTTGAGSASGTRVNALAFGHGKGNVTNAGTLAALKGYGLINAGGGVKTMALANTVAAIANKKLGWVSGPVTHTAAAGSEQIDVYFNGMGITA